MNIATFTNQLIIKQYKSEVSDIHFKPERDHVDIYNRLHGEIHYYRKISLDEYKMILRYIKYMAKLDLGVSMIPQDGSLTINSNTEEIFIRISTVPLIFSESLVIRILNENNPKDIFSIALFPSDLQTIYEQIICNTGLFVFTGPTGSGKSTSMYALLERAAIEGNKKIICIEDPVEVINTNFTQIQINEKVDLTYANCLKACLRQDPDIIMIGEIRDELTAKYVFRAALTGHTVISTMHTKNKYGVVERFLDFDFKDSEIKSVLIGISNQRLIINSEDEIKALYDFAVGSELEELITNGEVDNISDKLDVLGIGATKI